MNIHVTSLSMAAIYSTERIEGILALVPRCLVLESLFYLSIFDCIFVIFSWVHELLKTDLSKPSMDRSGRF